MQCVQLVVPKHLYDQLGLQPNQTITFHNSQSVSELRTDENNASTSNSSDDHEPLLAKLKTVDGQSNEMSLKEPTGAFQVIHFNAENTPNLETATLLSNSDSSSDIDTSKNNSDNSNDGDISAGEMHAADCVIDRVDVEETDQHSIEKPPVLQKLTIHGLGRQVVSFPRQCEKCSRIFPCHASFGLHKKTCCLERKKPISQLTKKKISYPRICPVCNRCYANRSSYAKHHRLCAEFKKKQTLSYLQNFVQPRNSPNVHVLGSGRIDRSSSNTSGDLDTSAKDSTVLNTEGKPERWIPVTNNLVHMHKFFVVKSNES